MLIVARFGSPADPVVMLIGDRARELLTDAALLFGTLDEIGCTLHTVRAMSVEPRSLVVATVDEPTNTLTPIVWMSQVVAADALDGEHVDDKQHAIVARPDRVRTEHELQFIAQEYFELRFPKGREPTDRERARAFARVGRFDRSVELLRALVRDEPDNAPLLFHLGEMLQRIGKPEEAIPVLQRSAALAPQQYDPRSSLAIAYVACHRYAEAKQVYLDLIAMSGGDFGDWMNLASICRDTGDFEEGQRAVSRALGLEPQSAHAHAIAAGLAAALGDHEVARRHCDAAEAYLASADPQSPMYGVIRGLIEQARRQPS